MQLAEYITVYQIAPYSPNWLIAFAGVAPFVIGIGLVACKRRFRWQRPSWLSLFCLSVFGMFCVLIVCGAVFAAGHSEPFNAYQSGKYSVVEGVVTDFDPMPYAGHKDECFSVGSERFCYSDYEITAGFHTAASHGGPIRSGLSVRIAHLGDIILRLDVAKDQAPSLPDSKSVLESARRQWEMRVENDPIQQRMMTAFLFTFLCITVWWNWQWRRAMRFWVRPPNRPIVQYGFRIFFVLSLAGSLVEFMEQLRHHPLSRQNLEPTIVAAALMGCAVGGMMALVLTWRERNDRQQT